MQDDGFGWPSPDREALIRAAIGAGGTASSTSPGPTGCSTSSPAGPARSGWSARRRRTSSPASGRAAPTRSGRWSRSGCHRAGQRTGTAERCHGGPSAIPPPAADILDTDKAPDDLAAALRALFRRSNQEYLDRGLRVLYLAFGALTWADEDQARYTSPLLLVPARLVAPAPRSRGAGADRG